MAEPQLGRGTSQLKLRPSDASTLADESDVRRSGHRDVERAPAELPESKRGKFCRSALPLAGVKVVDFGQYIAGPLVGLLLADQGAVVTKVEPPGGPRWQSGANATLNRGKHSVVLDLTTPEGRAEAKSLVDHADVVIENFRPGVMASFDLEPRALRDQFPQLVTLSLPGFASDDEENADVKAYEGMISAATGVFTDMGLDRILEGYSPCYSALPQASVYGAVMGAVAVVAALVAREDHGLGDTIEVPLASALLEGLCFNATSVNNLPQRYYSNRVLEIDRRRENGLPFDLTREQVLDLQEAFFRLYKCRDGEYVYLVTMGHLGHVHRLLHVLGVEAEVKKICPSGDLWDASTWTGYSEVTKSKCMLEMMYIREPFSTEIRNILKNKFLERDAQQWSDMLGKARVPCTLVQSLKDWLHSAQALESGLATVKDGEIQIGPLCWMEGETSAADNGDGVDLPSGNGILIKSCTETPQKPWLQGLKVLCVCNVIAGPMVSVTLARFGAEVIQLTDSNTLFDPRMPVQFGLLAHRCKRSVLADLKAEGGKELLARLVKWADVVVFNGTKQQLAPLGLDYSSLRCLNPNIIFCLLDAWSGPHPGPWSERVGYDDIVQAATGIMVRFGEPGQPTEHAHIGTIDVMCGWGGAFACVCALLRRKRRGMGGFCRTSLASAGQHLQIPFAYDHPGRVFDETCGKARGAHALHGCFKCTDGWLFVAATAADAKSTEIVMQKQRLATFGIHCVEDFCRGKTRGEAREALQKAKISAAPLSSLVERREKMNSSSFIFEEFTDHPSGMKVVHPAQCAVRSNAPQHSLGTSRKLGIDTRAVMEEFGLGEHFDRWIAAGHVAEKLSEKFFPD